MKEYRHFNLLYAFSSEYTRNSNFYLLSELVKASKTEVEIQYTLTIIEFKSTENLSPSNRAELLLTHNELSEKLIHLQNESRRQTLESSEID